jgi:hypothetical protein
MGLISSALTRMCKPRSLGMEREKNALLLHPAAGGMRVSRWCGIHASHYLTRFDFQKKSRGLGQTVGSRREKQVSGGVGCAGQFGF